ncbi:MAG: hypothetical protein NUV47_00885 [Patescibacteria group bacterium]|nr:hypothetical protein [Patescibacteria group bacterium]
MDTKFQSSFIPKKPLVPTGRPETHHRSINFFFLIGSIIFLVVIAGVLYVFIATQFLNRSITQSEQTLEKARQAFDPSLIDTLTNLDTRFKTGKTLLGSHIAVSPFFGVLESMTLKTVRFQDFEYTLISNDKVNVTMKGEGESFSSIALQSDAFGKSKLFKNPIISNLVVGQNGNVSFDFSASIDPSLVLYKNSSISEPVVNPTVIEVNVSSSTPQ